MQIIGDPAIKGLLYVRCPARDPKHLNENDFWRVIDAEISILWIDQLAVGVEGDEPGGGLLFEPFPGVAGMNASLVGEIGRASCRERVSSVV